MYRYGLERYGLPLYVPEGLEEVLEVMVGNFGDTFDWHTVGDGDKTMVGEAALRFSRTDHPPPTVAVEIAHDGKRLIYTADTGAEWSVDAFGAGADLVLSEATYMHDDIRVPIHYSARQAGELAREADARRLMITHLWPTLDPVASVAEASEGFGAAITLAAPHMSTHV
jgi:ribonuclease BN (tRNA processing enzyme)